MSDQEIKAQMIDLGMRIGDRAERALADGDQGLAELLREAFHMLGPRPRYLPPGTLTTPPDPLHLAGQLQSQAHLLDKGGHEITANLMRDACDYIKGTVAQKRERPVCHALRDTAQRMNERVPVETWTWARYFVRPVTAEQFKRETPASEGFTDGPMRAIVTDRGGGIPGPVISISPAVGLGLDLLLVTDATGQTHAETVRLGAYGG